MTWPFQRDDYRMGVPFSNGSGEQVPAFAVIKQTTSTIANGNFVIGAIQYTADNTNPCWPVFINRATNTADEKHGVCTPATDEPTLALCNSTTVGQIVGPSEGSWSLGTGHPGFVVMGAGPASSTAFVMRTPEVTIVKGTCEGNAGTGDAITINTVTTMSGLEVVSGTENTISVENLFGDTTNSSGQKMTALYNKSQSQWDSMDITPICNT